MFEMSQWITCSVNMSTTVIYLEMVSSESIWLRDFITVTMVLKSSSKQSEKQFQRVFVQSVLKKHGFNCWMIHFYNMPNRWPAYKPIT